MSGTASRSIQEQKLCNLFTANIAFDSLSQWKCDLECIKTLKFKYMILPEVEYFLLIKANFRVETCKRYMKVVTIDLVNTCMNKFRHVKKIVCLANTPC